MAPELPIKEDFRPLKKEPKKEADEDRLVSWKDIQCNYSAMMYVLTEQQALIGVLLEQLVRAGVLDSVQLEKITGIYGNIEVLNPVYSDLYKRFANYYLSVRTIMENSQEDVSGSAPDTPFPGEKKDD
jgi:hypothetical protein